MENGEHHYFVLRTPDLAASSRFFHRLLGWEVDGGELTNLAFLGALSDRHDRSIWVHVADVDAACGLVRDLGGAPGDVVDGRSGRSVTCRDDQGNEFHMGTLVPEYRDHPRPSPLPLGELGYVTLTVGDTARAVDFYGRLFGWTFTAPGEAGVQPQYRHCTNGALPFGFTAGGDVSPGFYFRVPDAAAMRRAITDLGGAHGGLVESATGSTLTGCTDPVGVRFELWQPADGL